MSFTIEKLPDAPILVMVHKDGTFMAEFAEGVSALLEALDAQPEPVFLVFDVHAVSISLDELTMGASVLARNPGALMHHPMVQENLVVSRDGLFKLGAVGLRTATFGGVKIRTFDTLDQAIAYCHENIAEKSST